MIKNCKQIFVDGTFIICPKKYYQILHIAGYLEEIKGIIPLLIIPCTGKSDFLYDMIFKGAKLILFKNNIDEEDITEQFMCDFEKSLINSIKNNFKNEKLMGIIFILSNYYGERLKH